MQPDDIRRFRSKVDRSSDDGCWPWLGSTNRTGYAVFWMDGRQERAARIALDSDREVARLLDEAFG